MIKKENLDFWIKNDLNVLFEGKHGVGKTAMVKEAFDRNNLKWKYFSASTMDPWVDLVGVPKEVKDEDGNSYLDLVRPREFQNDSVEALFFDEMNRSHKKVRNAVMELIQFKSINGKKFSNLKIVWAAINPEDEEETYDVEKLDPAQEDRFQIKVEIPYKPNKAFFTNKFGPESAAAAISWWNGLPIEQKNLVSPRRLDYALDILKKGGDVRYCLPKSSNVSKLITTLELGPIEQSLKKLAKDNNEEEITNFLMAENNYNACIDIILSKPNYYDVFLPRLQDEKLSTLMSKNKKVTEFVVSKMCSNEKFYKLVENIVASEANKKLSKRISTSIKKEYGSVGVVLGTGIDAAKFGTMAIKPYYSDGSYGTYGTVLAGLPAVKTYSTTQDRAKIYKAIRDNIPKKLDEILCTTTLTILGDIARKSQTTTLIGLDDFFGVVNHCIVELCRLSNINDWKSLYTKYEKHFTRLISKCDSENNLSRRLYIPSSNKEPVWYDKYGKQVGNKYPF